MYAVCLGRVGDTSIATPDVDEVGNWLRVAWVDAESVTALMVKFLALGDRPNDLRVDENMGWIPMRSAVGNEPVAMSLRPSPVPASGARVNLVALLPTFLSRGVVNFGHKRIAVALPT